MSAPAAKALSEPVRTMAEIDGSCSASVRAVLSSLKSAEERAFRALGRLRRTEGTLLVVLVWNLGGLELT